MFRVRGLSQKSTQMELLDPEKAVMNLVLSEQISRTVFQGAPNRLLRSPTGSRSSRPTSRTPWTIDWMRRVALRMAPLILTPVKKTDTALPRKTSRPFCLEHLISFWKEANTVVGIRKRYFHGTNIAHPSSACWIASPFRMHHSRSVLFMPICQSQMTGQ